AGSTDNYYKDGSSPSGVDEEAALRDAACGGSSGQGGRLEGTHSGDPGVSSAFLSHAVRAAGEGLWNSPRRLRVTTSTRGAGNRCLRSRGRRAARTCRILLFLGGRMP